jgi:hypothetical protein
MTHWRASGGASWLCDVDVVAIAWLQATSATVAVRSRAGRVKVSLELGVVESERPSEEGRSKHVLQV